MLSCIVQPYSGLDNQTCPRLTKGQSIFYTKLLIQMISFQVNDTQFLFPIPDWGCGGVVIGALYWTSDLEVGGLMPSPCHCVVSLVKILCLNPGV